MIRYRLLVFSIFLYILCSAFKKDFFVKNNHKNFQHAADSADIIINKYIEAIGGIEKLKSIYSVYMQGSVIIRGQKTSSKTWIVGNKVSRTESSFGGFTNWSIVRTDSAWSFNPRRGQKFPEPWPSERVKTARPGLDIEGTLVNYKKKGYTVEYEGIDQIEGSDAYKIEEKINDAVTKTFYIDLDSYLIIRVRSKFTTSTRVNYSNTDYSNYQKTKDGYVFPMDAGNIKYNIIDINPEISDSLFIPKK